MVSKQTPPWKSDNFGYFSRFFSVFTAIFLVMTVIILNILHEGIYSTVDDGLLMTQNEINHYVNFQMELTHSPRWDKEKPPVKDIPNQDFQANTEFILYDTEGNIINSLNTYEGLDEFPLDKTQLGQIQTKTHPNLFNRLQLYRTLTAPVTNVNYPEVAFATILINTTQLEVNNDRAVRIVVSVMVVFWIMSIFASLYLAQWARRPVVESFERQKAFVENASHELRTPLAVLQNRLEGLFRKPDATILDQSESIAASLDEVRNMKLLTTNLLNLARRDDGMSPNLEEVPVSFFDDIFANYDLIASEANKVFVGQNQLTQAVKTDKVLFKQMLTILFDNALKYTNEDGQVTIRLSQLDKTLTIEVKDNGIGIPEMDKHRIFDRFYRVDKARTRQNGGFGLGLALAKQIVLSLGGSITVSDNQPQGSVFKVVL